MDHPAFAQPSSVHRAPHSRHRLGAGLLLAGLALASCGGGGGGGSLVPGIGGSSPRLAEVRYGRLVDIYGYDAIGSLQLHLKDVLIGPNIDDERPPGSNKPDSEVTYDFINTDPDTLQQRVLIPRAITSVEFNDAFAALDDELHLVTPGYFGQNTQVQPFSVVPRNCGFRLTFTHDLGITEDFFVEKDPSGRVTGVKNAEAVQVLEIVGDPNDPDPVGDFRVITSRFVPRGNMLIVDPVLLGSEGLQYSVHNNASGLPESADQIGGNIRIALALEGPLAIPGLREDPVSTLTGPNNSGTRSVLRDFRSGNRNDFTPEISQGFVRDPIPMRLAGQIVMFLERVEDLNQANQIVTLFKNGISHEIDRGDVIRLVVDNTGVPAAVTEVVVDPDDDAGKPAVQHVRVVVRRQFRTAANGSTVDIFRDWDPSDPTRSNSFWQEHGQIPAYGTPTLEAWLPLYAPKAVLVAEFTGARLDPLGNLYGDDPRYFVTFSPAPLPGPSGIPGEPNENVDPFARAIVRFTKPADLASVRPLDTFFFATRDLLDSAKEAEFIAEKDIDPASFIRAKYWTPHLVAARKFDEDGSQTSIRLEPPLGFYLDEIMRRADEGQPFAQKRFRYYLHVLGGLNGIKDLSGNELDFQTGSLVRQDHITIPFSLDTRRTQTGVPAHPDNIVISIARRFHHEDEDEQPSYHRSDEVQQPGTPVNYKAFNLQDVFGAVIHLPDGTLSARQTGRVRQVVDDFNQLAPPQQESPTRYCPFEYSGQGQKASATGAAKGPNAIQNPLNPNGCRLQTLWREIDMSLSRTEPADFNLDVEGMFWGPFTAAPTTFDVLDQVSLYLGHSERRAEPCVGLVSALPTLPNSGLVVGFANNFVKNFDPARVLESQPAPHPAYVDQPLTILSSLTVREPTGVNRFLPLPQFQKPYFVWRDERVKEQGGESQEGNDTNPSTNNYAPYILSPFLTGRGRRMTAAGTLASGYWENRKNFRLVGTGAEDITDGLVGAIALPLLADFHTLPDSPNLPQGNPFLASGLNGWQIALTVQSSPLPAFRAYSAGGVFQGQVTKVDPTSPKWETAQGGINPLTGNPTAERDNSLFWVMADYLKRLSVMTGGFVEVLNPHRMPTSGTLEDPRLGPYLGRVMPPNVRVRYEYDFDPPLLQLPAGTKLAPEFRGAGKIDDLTIPGLGSGPWAAVINLYQPATPPSPLQPWIANEYPDETNFPLDPLKAGDAHIRKLDQRSLPSGEPRNTWTYYYNNNVTDYTPEPNDLADERFTNRFSGPNETFLPQDVKYFNWRFIFENNVDTIPPVAPVIDSFSVVYRLENR